MTTDPGREPDPDDATCLVCGCTRNVSRERRDADLVAELRRQLAARDRQLDRLRAGL